ncbi:hypothetical protein FKM82_017060 [Ascaphus truei]
MPLPPSLPRTPPHLCLVPPPSLPRTPPTLRAPPHIISPLYLMCCLSLSFSFLAPSFFRSPISFSLGVIDSSAIVPIAVLLCPPHSLFLSLSSPALTRHSPPPSSHTSLFPLSPPLTLFPLRPSPLPLINTRSPLTHSLPHCTILPPPSRPPLTLLSPTHLFLAPSRSPLLSSPPVSSPPAHHSHTPNVTLPTRTPTPRLPRTGGLPPDPLTPSCPPPHQSPSPPLPFSPVRNHPSLFSPIHSLSLCSPLDSLSPSPLPPSTPPLPASHLSPSPHLSVPPHPPAPPLLHPPIPTPGSPGSNHQTGVPPAPPLSTAVIPPLSHRKRMRDANKLHMQRLRLPLSCALPGATLLPAQSSPGDGLSAPRGPPLQPPPSIPAPPHPRATASPRQTPGSPPLAPRTPRANLPHPRGPPLLPLPLQPHPRGLPPSSHPRGQTSSPRPHLIPSPKPVTYPSPTCIPICKPRHRPLHRSSRLYPSLRARSSGSFSTA